eukprot:CAMPEP_0197448384 /NCGR_PEP_ID=MMETSP1175-20131217/17199_1 /TAXON_ID=1003142 /ORGANISM="Triceratium dubium, Strain CCMP147" /LENGTH=134 /DNA_ID=CAMNT_0042980111 /DNA_START=22 /DNA_END=426 /DNA_ORIENTATION=-
MSEVTVKTRRFLTNRLLSRRQFVVDVLHPGQAPVSRAKLQKELARMYKADAANVFVFGFKTKFGGGKSTGFGLIYDNAEAAKKFEPRYRLIREGMAEKRSRGRKAFKDLKKKRRTTWGTGRREAARKARKAAAA